MGRRRFALVLVFVALVRLIEHRLLATALINGGSSERGLMFPRRPNPDSMFTKRSAGK